MRRNKREGGEKRFRERPQTRFKKIYACIGTDTHERWRSGLPVTRHVHIRPIIFLLLCGFYICSKGAVEGGFMSQRPEGIALLSIPHHYIDSNRCASQQTCNYHPENVAFLTETTAVRRGGGGESKWEGEKRALDWEKVRGKEERGGRQV